MKNKRPMYEFRFTRAYIEDKSYLIYKQIREKFHESLPPFNVTTYNGKKRTGTFLLLDGPEKLPVYCDEQGHVRQADKVSLYRWFEKNQPKEGDILQWYITDNPNEFSIKLVQSEDYVPQQPTEIINEKTQSKPIVERALKDINKFFELKEKGVLSYEEFTSLKDEVLTKFMVTIDNIESLYHLCKKGAISENEYKIKKNEFISTFKGGDVSAESST